MSSTQTRQLRLFSCFTGEPVGDGQIAILVWCYTEQYARTRLQLAIAREEGFLPEYGLPPRDEAWTCQDVTYDVPMLLWSKERGKELRREVQRYAGWMEDGDDSCDACELYEMGGLHPVCEVCRQCDECGCSCEEEGGEES